MNSATDNPYTDSIYDDDTYMEYESGIMWSTICLLAVLISLFMVLLNLMCNQPTPYPEWAKVKKNRLKTPLRTILEEKKERID